MTEAEKIAHLSKPVPTKDPKTSPERTPIRIDKLFFTAPNVHGIKLPDGPQGGSERIVPNLTAGEHGTVRIEIEHRPWMRVFRVTRTQKVTRSGVGKDAKEIETWEPMGKPFHIPDTWAVSVPVEE
jgi:hypothetical protein